VTRPFSKREIVVSGEIISLDTGADLLIRDISTDMDNVASQMAWWGSVQALAECEKEQVDAQYRKWRAEKILEVDPKFTAPEWRVKALVEADDEFLAHKAEIARTIDNALAAKAMFMAFEKKANTLQSRGANQRTERDKAGGVRTYERSAPAEGTSKAIRGIAKHHRF
jgi:hypothetical protein